MTALAFSATETLLYDYSDSDNFYVLVKPPEIAQTTLFVVSPAFAQSWFGLNNPTVIYNPFLFSGRSGFSTVVQQ